jgi:hypothetical protein
MIIQEIDTLLQEITRWKKQAFLTHGGTKILGTQVGKNSAIRGQSRLSKDSLERIRQAGIIKPKDEYQAGINYGSRQIANKAGVKRIVSDKSSFYDAEKNQIHTQGDPISTRHEAYEARSQQNRPAAHRIYRGETLVGNHNSPSVLRAEKRLHDQHKTLYGTSIDPSLTHFRKRSKEYGSFVQNVSDKDINKAEQSRRKLINDRETVTRDNYKVVDRLKRRQRQLADRSFNASNTRLDRAEAENPKAYETLDKLIDRSKRERDKNRSRSLTAPVLHKYREHLIDSIRNNVREKEKRINSKLEARIQRELDNPKPIKLPYPTDTVQIDGKRKKIRYSE